MANTRKSSKEIQEKLAATMKIWQKIEDSSVASTGRVIEKTENPIVRLVMEIIQRDSQMHHRVQGFIVETMNTMVSLTPDEVGDVWGMIEDHIKLERKTLELATAALESTKDSKGMLVQSYLLEYLLEDEKKHNALLDRLNEIQKGMYPYG
jgi:hypothetical protein